MPTEYVKIPTNTVFRASVGRPWLLEHFSRSSLQW